jgi:hypothetical protein
MYTLRCTRKLLRRIDEIPSSEVVSPTTVLGDWYANLLYLRPQQLVLAMNERTLHMCAGASGARSHGRGATAARGGRAAPGHRSAGGRLRRSWRRWSTSRSGPRRAGQCWGCMNDAVYQLEYYPRGGRGELDLRSASLHLADNIYSLTDYARPWVRALELFGVGAGEQVTVRMRRWH